MDTTVFYELFKKIRKPFAIIVGSLVLLWFLITFFTSGIITTEGSFTKDTLITLTKNGAAAQSLLTIKPGFSIVPAGSYLAEIKEPNSRAVYKQLIKIDNFLRISKLSFTKTPQSLAQLSVPVKNTVFSTINNSLTVSYNPGDSSVINDSEPKSPLYFDTCSIMCTQLYPYTSTLALGYSQQNGVSAQIMVVDLVAKTITPLSASSYTSFGDLVINAHDGSFAVYDGNKKIYHYSSLQSQPKEVALSERPAHGDNQYLIGITKDSLVTATGPDYSAPTSGDNPQIVVTDKQSKGNYQIINYSLSGGEIKKSTITNHSLVYKLSVSPDTGGSHYTLSAANEFEVRNSNDNSIVFSEPLSNVTAIEWLDSNSIAYADGYNGIYKSTMDGSSSPIFATDAFNVSAFRLIGDTLYATLFPNTIASGTAYSLTIDPQKNEYNNSLISTDPIRSGTTYNLLFDGKTFTVMRKYNFAANSYVQGSMQEAYDYIKTVAKDPIIVTRDGNS